jgi:hypothetical protein
LPEAAGLPDTVRVSRSRPPRRWAIAATVAASTLVAGACGPATSDPTAGRSLGTAAETPISGPPASRPSPTPAIPGLSWVQATTVERPDEAFAGASAVPTIPSGPGTAGHPGHFPGQAIVDDVAQAGERLVAVGYVGIRGSWTAISWTSSDGERWDLGAIDDTPGSFAVSIVASPSGGGRVVAVGRSGSAPVAWDSPDGRTWTRRTVPTLGDGAEWERIVTVLVTDTGFIAGGSVGPELGDRRARFWRSADGTTWESIPDDPAFAGAEVVSIARRGSGYVAVGRLGTGQRGSGSIAWVSDDAIRWQRIDSAALASGLVAAVAVAPDGSMVAVGSDLDEREALVWRSADGTTWKLTPGEESRLYNGDKIRMTDVAPVLGVGFVAVGNYVGVQFGTATSWISADGITWLRSAGHPALEQGEMLAVTVGRSNLVAVGSFGAPDNYIPTIWRGPLPNGG